MKNRRTSLLLGIIFVVLLGLTVAVNVTRQNNAPPLEFPTAPPLVFPDVEQTQITRIEMENHLNGKSITLVKQPGDWEGKDKDGQPIQVDYGQIARMLQVLATLRYNRIMEGSDVKAFGLTAGGYFLVRFDAGRSYTLTVGDQNSDHSFVFIQRAPDEPVLQVSAPQMSVLLAMVATTPGGPVN